MRADVRAGLRTVDSVLRKLAVVMGALAELAACTPKQTALPTRSLDAPSTAAQGQALGKRIALVVGNSSYASSPLTNPVNDAALIAATLADLGFEVQLQKNSDQAGMKRAIQAFGAALERAGADSVGLFYYAGHGVQLNGRNYLIPVGANIERDADVEIEAVSADWVLEQMRYARNRLNFVILDACRNNPFARSFRSADHGLAKMDAPAGVLIAYSTAPGDVAADGAGANSPYTESLSRAMRESDQAAELMFKQARDSVRQMTSERQTPWEASSLTGQNFYFAGAKRVARIEPAPNVASDPVAAAPERPPAARDSTVPVVEAARPADATPPEAGFSTTPEFLSEPLCARAVGEWRTEINDVHGRLRLNAQAAGIAKLSDDAPTIKLTWRCNGPARAVFITFEGDVTYKATMDDTEKLMFGYDGKGTPVIYRR